MEQYLIDVQVEEDWPADAALVRRAVLATLVHQDAPAVEVAVVISGDDTLRELNRRFRDIDAATDVLSFPNDESSPFAGIGGQPRYLGDVIVSFPRAEAQAGQAGHDVQAELQLLVVHGVLHLLGYDDQEAQARARMWAVQEAILDALGVRVELPEL